jgi:hypothetical protein
MRFLTLSRQKQANFTNDNRPRTIVDGIPNGMEMHTLSMPYENAEDVNVILVGVERTNSIHGSYLNGNFLVSNFFGLCGDRKY